MGTYRVLAPQTTISGTAALLLTQASGSDGYFVIELSTIQQMHL